MSEKKLALLVLQLLDLQRATVGAYGPRKEAVAEEARQAEAHIRKVCEGIVGPKQDESPKLFGNDSPTVD